jgi:hypothetical protein
MQEATRKPVTLALVGNLNSETRLTCEIALRVSATYFLSAVRASNKI